MHKKIFPLNALRAFEAAARHLSLMKAADELHVTPSAISHQIRTLEEVLDQKLFVRKVRAIELTSAGKLLYPGLQTGFSQIYDAIGGLQPSTESYVLVISTPPGFTAMWLAPRMFRFATAYPDIDTRISSSMEISDFRTDGVDIAMRNLPIGEVVADDLVAEELIKITLVPVCSPKLAALHAPLASVDAIARMPLIHDETFRSDGLVPGWHEWLETAGINNVDLGRGLRFNSADHALHAAIEGAGVLLAHEALAHDDLRTGRLVQPFELALPTKRAYHLVYPRDAAERSKVLAFRHWISEEIETMRNDR